jgi:Toxin PAAR-like domain/GHH signature containing HNH/Endo VII superfamily nuclease toxin  2
MGNDVFANGREISCKAADGKAICAFPDVCFTPPQTPATPPGVPIPYPNTGMASDATQGTKNVKISGKEVMLKNKSYFKKSTGDEAGSAPKKGVVTSTNTGKVYFNSWSMDVQFEGENVVRHLDLTTHNHASFPGDTPTWPYIDEVSGVAGKGCEKERTREDEACGHHETQEEKCADPVCQHAQRCMLRPYAPLTSEGQEGCCDTPPPKQTPHHLVEGHGFCEAGTNKPLAQFAGDQSSSPPVPAYKYLRAPCVCVVGTNQYSGTHKFMHAIQGARERAAITQAAQSGGDPRYAWTYAEARDAGIEALRNVMGKQCSQECLKAQIDNYHKQIDVEDNTPLRTEWPGMDTAGSMQTRAENAGISVPTSNPLTSS